MKSWFVYIVKCVDDSLYTGITVDVESRVTKHNKGDGAKYTRARLPVELVWYKKCKNESFARKREAEIKGWSRSKKLELIGSS
ncbi:GIY-YIG nuclease family protein [Patescibacteria group bacterium]|nr:GIY-YIG nuclease family protein [Patescibacteria group bacterium]